MAGALVSRVLHPRRRASPVVPVTVQPPPLSRSVTVARHGAAPGQPSTVPHGVPLVDIGSADGIPATNAVADALLAARTDLVALVARTSAPVDAHWLDHLAAAITGRTAAATALLVHPVRPLLRATPHDGRVREAGWRIDLVDGAPLPRARGAGDHVERHRAVETVDAASSACLVLDRAAVERVGGLDRSLDLDAALVVLFARLRRAGHDAVVVPDALVADHRPVVDRAALTRPWSPGSSQWRAALDRAGPLLRRAFVPGADRLSIALTVAAPSEKVAARWGDWHLAEALGRALRRHDVDVRVQTLDRADDPASRVRDVQIVLRGMRAPRRTPGQRHVLWVISHPETLTDDELDDADLVLVASERFARALRSRTATPVEVMLQATDPERFSPRPPQPRYRHDVAVVAKSRGVLRAAVADALAAGLRPAIYGGGWDGLVDADLVVAEHVPNEDLPSLYSSVGVLLNDHWDTMAAWGFVSNRIFDALACGAPVVSDHLPEIPALFGDAVATYTTPADLRATVNAILSDPDAARARAARGRDLVLQAHTFDRRAVQLLNALARYGLDHAPDAP